MAVLNFDHTLATFIKIKNDLSSLLHIITIMTQVLFIGFYTYLIVVNVERLAYLIVYSVFCGLTLAYLLYYLIRLRGMAARVKRIESKLVRRLYRIGKYLLKNRIADFGDLLLGYCLIRKCKSNFKRSLVSVVVNG